MPPKKRNTGFSSKTKAVQRKKSTKTKAVKIAECRRSARIRKRNMMMKKPTPYPTRGSRVPKAKPSNKLPVRAKANKQKCAEATEDANVTATLPLEATPEERKLEVPSKARAGAPPCPFGQEGDHELTTSQLTVTSQENEAMLKGIILGIQLGKEYKRELEMAVGPPSNLDAFVRTLHASPGTPGGPGTPGTSGTSASPASVISNCPNVGQRLGDVSLPLSNSCQEGPSGSKPTGNPSLYDDQTGNVGNTQTQTETHGGKNRHYS